MKLKQNRAFRGSHGLRGEEVGEERGGCLRLTGRDPDRPSEGRTAPHARRETGKDPSVKSLLSRVNTMSALFLLFPFLVPRSHHHDPTPAPSHSPWSRQSGGHVPASSSLLLSCFPGLCFPLGPPLPLPAHSSRVPRVCARERFQPPHRVAVPPRSTSSLRSSLAHWPSSGAWSQCTFMNFKWNSQGFFQDAAELACGKSSL